MFCDYSLDSRLRSDFFRVIYLTIHVLFEAKIDFKIV
jgi:hypothetical protein